MRQFNNYKKFIYKNGIIYPKPFLRDAHKHKTTKNRPLNFDVESPKNVKTQIFQQFFDIEISSLENFPCQIIYCINSYNDERCFTAFLRYFNAVK